MKIGSTNLWGSSLDEFRKDMQLAKSLGFDIIGIGDSPAGWRELYTTMAVAAQEVDNAIISTSVTSPFLRHPLTVASAISTLQALSGGRIQLGLSTGGSNMWAIGHKPATQVEIKQYWDALKKLLNGEEIEWENRPVSPLKYPRKTPFFYSAFGPRALTFAGENADGVMILTDSDLTATKARIDQVKASANARGRNPEDIEIWATGFCSIASDRKMSIHELKAFIAAQGLLIRTPDTLAKVPSHLRPKLRKLQENYDPSEHVIENGKNCRLLDALGTDLTDFLFDYGGFLAGTEKELAPVFHQLEEMGVSAYITTLPGHGDRRGHMKKLANLLKNSL